MKWFGWIGLCVACIAFGFYIGYLTGHSGPTGAVLKVENLNAIPTAETEATVVWEGAPEGSIAFYPGYAPCAPAGNPPSCVITPGLAENLYAYQISSTAAGSSKTARDPAVGLLRVVPCPHCPSGSGTGTVVQVTGVQAGLPTPPLISLLCLGGKAGSIPASPQAVLAGTSVKWFSNGGADPDWSVTFADPAICGASPFNRANPTCTVANVATGDYTYTINLPDSPACKLSPGQGTLHVGQ